jgi:hypothetical protein
MATPFRRPHSREDRRDPRLPPRQYDSGTTFSLLTAEITPHLDLAPEPSGPTYLALEPSGPTG